jgi:hypothetical protein
MSAGDAQDLAQRQESWRAAAQEALERQLDQRGIADPTVRATALPLLVTLEVMERTAHELQRAGDPGWHTASEAAMRLWNHLGRLGYPQISRLAEELGAGGRERADAARGSRKRRAPPRHG